MFRRGSECVLIFLMKPIYEGTYTFALNFNRIFSGDEFSKVPEH